MVWGMKKAAFYGAALETFNPDFALCVPDACFLGQPHNSSGCCRACCNCSCCDVLSKKLVHVQKYRSRCRSCQEGEVSPWLQPCLVESHPRTTFLSSPRILRCHPREGGDLPSSTHSASLPSPLRLGAPPLKPPLIRHPERSDGFRLFLNNPSLNVCLPSLADSLCSTVRLGSTHLGQKTQTTALVCKCFVVRTCFCRQEQV